MSKSVVKSVVFVKSGKGKYGDYHIFTVEFENGDKGNYMSKKNPQTSFTEGEEAEYEVVEENGYKNIKPAKKDFKGGYKANPKVHALNNAVLLAAHGQIKLDEIKKYADNFVNYLEG